MADSSVPVSPGTGANIDTRTNAGGEHRQVVVPGGNGDFVAGATSWGHLRVSVDPTSMLFENFNTSPLNTAEKWTVVGTSPTIAGNGNAVFPTTVSTNSTLISKPIITASSSQWLQYNSITTIEGTTAGTGAGRFFGVGTAAGTPSSTALVADGIGFEVLASDGSLRAAVYKAGVATFTQALTRPTDGLPHRYSMTYRTSGVVWYIDGTDIPVASMSFPDVNTVDMPMISVRNNAATLGGTPVFTLGSIGISDWSRSATHISDPIDTWKEARVSKDGGLKVGDGRNKTYEGFASTFRLVGTTGTTTNLFTMENTAGSGVLVAIRRVAVDIATSAVTAYMLNSYVRLYRGTTVPAGGTTMTKYAVDTTQTSAANVILRAPASADGTATAITYATPAGNPMRSQAHPGIMTGSGIWNPDDLTMWDTDFTPLILRPGESILVVMNGAASATHLHYTTKVVWEEFTS